MPGERRSFFFGTHGRSGHSAKDDEGRSVPYNTLCLIWGAQVDSDSTYPSEREGEAAVYHRGDRTLLGFADRTDDRRGGSHAAFILPGALTYAEAVEAARAAFPRVWERFAFEVRPAESSGEEAKR